MAEPIHRGQTRVLDARGQATALLRTRVNLVVESGVDLGRGFEVERGLVRIGSAPDNDVVLRDDFVSGRHAEIELSDQGFVLRDLGSTNGTVLGGFRVREALLEPGARLKLGETTVRFEPGGRYEVALGQPGAHGIAGESLAIRECVALLEKFARSDAPVLVCGETGVGKDLFARALHRLSGRRAGPFEVFDCGAVTPSLAAAEGFGRVTGAFGRAHGGTLLLDGIGALPLDLQQELLRIGEPFDVRVVAAARRDLQSRVAQGKFRGDLFDRLSAQRVEIPPLRKRREDVAPIARALLAAMERPGDTPLRLDGAAVAMLESYDWPGNVRELGDVLRRAAALTGEAMTAGDLVVARQGLKGGERG